MSSTEHEMTDHNLFAEIASGGLKEHTDYGELLTIPEFLEY